MIICQFIGLTFCAVNKVRRMLGFNKYITVSVNTCLAE